MSHPQHMCVSTVPIFNHLDKDTLRLIHEQITHQSYERGEYLFRAGDPSNVLYIIHRGMVKITRLTSSGKEQVIRMVGPGDFIGERTLFNEAGTHDNYAEVIAKAEICVLQGDDFAQLLSDYPAVALRILGEVSQRLADSERQTTYVSTAQVGSRLALYLADLAGEAEGEVTVTLPITRKDLASYLGTTPESISRKFKKLEDQGYITQQKGKEVLIYNVDELLFYNEDV